MTAASAFAKVFFVGGTLAVMRTFFSDLVVVEDWGGALAWDIAEGDNDDDDVETNPTDSKWATNHFFTLSIEPPAGAVLRWVFSGLAAQLPHSCSSDASPNPYSRTRSPITAFLVSFGTSDMFFRSSLCFCVFFLERTKETTIKEMVLCYKILLCVYFCYSARPFYMWLNMQFDTGIWKFTDRFFFFLFLLFIPLPPPPPPYSRCEAYRHVLIRRHNPPS